MEIAPGNMTETCMTSIDSMLTKGWIGDILTVTCNREPVSFSTRFTLILCILELQTTLAGLIYHWFW